MDTVSMIPGGTMGDDFGADAGDRRHEPADTWRPLRTEEIRRLIDNGNTAGDWDDVRVRDPFDPDCVTHSEFFGPVRLGRLEKGLLEHEGLRVPVGIAHSRIMACDLGDHVAIDHVRYLSHYRIGNRCLLRNIDEMVTTTDAVFGNGVVKGGPDAAPRLWINVFNEAGTRRISPFSGMRTADAWLWARYRDHSDLQAALVRMTQDRRPAGGGTVGDQAVIKSCRLIRNVRIGESACLRGANVCDNLTIHSDASSPTQIGEGVELVDGVIGFGCRITSGCKASRFVLADHATLQYGARLIDSFLGENSTIACCEVLNSLIFPAHQQHHNNSFLIATAILGQSNIAAGVTIGSNHNSRTYDHEFLAGRGFWPGLCSSFKHPCRFASFVLTAKGDYPAELNIPLPFALISNNVAQDRLEVMPAFWWLYNMYALVRNSWKFHDRDRRVRKTQPIEFDALAPDTAEELLAGRRLLETWTARADLRRQGRDAAALTPLQLRGMGRDLLSQPEAIGALDIRGEGLENARRDTVILKAAEGYAAYGEMLLYYAVTALMAGASDGESVTSLSAALRDRPRAGWVNLGGQLVLEMDADQLIADIADGTLADWEQVHARYDALQEAYPLKKRQHACQTLCELLDTDTLSAADWHAALDRAVDIQTLIGERVRQSRQKDFDNPFTQATCRNGEELAAVHGRLDEDGFLRQVEADTAAFVEAVRRLQGAE